LVKFSAMKFLPEEHTAVSEALATSGIPRDSFSFVKKKGYLHILHQGGHEFVFFRKKETKLNEHLQWVDLTNYYLVEGRKKTLLPSWEAVMVEFRQWLANLAQTR